MAALLTTLRSRARLAVRRMTNIPLSSDTFWSLPNLGVIRPRVNLLVIGAGKAGTTTIHNWLGTHPDIFMSSPKKEPQFFAPREILEPFKHIAPHKYETRPPQVIMRESMLQGYRGQRYFGEASPIYTNGHLLWSNPVPAIVGEYNPAMKLLYMVRHPYERIVSHAQQEIFKGRLEADLETIPEGHFRYLAQTSCYGHHLSHWLREFPSSQVKVVPLEDLRDDPTKLLDDIASFLDLPPFPTSQLRASNVTAKRSTVPAIAKFPAVPQIDDLISADLDLLYSATGRNFRALWKL